MMYSDNQTRSALFVLTDQKTNTLSQDFLMFVKMLEACGNNIKVDTRLPATEHRAQYQLFLVDVSHRECRDLLSAQLRALAQHHSVLLFNACPDTLNEQTALLANVKGVLYQGASPESQFKGIQRVLGGELWFGRGAISLAFSALMQRLPQTLPGLSDEQRDITLASLTKREKSVIRLLADGAKNDDIADSLNISSHTVKTHIYSAFKKTNSRNRIELANWAQQHIPFGGLAN
ncbi:DNA-binding response regulator [Pseudoalteromonas rubra]|uniref:DNA-binding response regulator n=2 Tax=Pseudoalteromonas rubra TaxID=43658 RepID=A0A4Q7E460_9GAMM|nr:response regulator transcription factor [Pseudoalteromonas rubra]RZM77517.1 DNA-binding response regulator [Pseudoalteromonas rubra]